jgi:hypothetical protein
VKDTTIFCAIGNIDDKLIIRAGNKAIRKRKSLKSLIKFAVPAAACLILVLAVVLPTILTKNNPTPPNGFNMDNVRMATSLDEIYGLPTSDCTADENGMALSDRLISNELRYLMRSFNRYDAPDVRTAFAIVQITQTQRFHDKKDWRGEHQISSGVVIFDVFGDEVVQPLKIKQYLNGGCICDEPTNMLRVGGVYVLPLVWYDGYEDGEMGIVYGDLDVLFEVDDNGLIQSHSPHEQLNKYDGQRLEALWNDIEYLYMNPILHSRFAEEISWGSGIAIDGNRIALHNPETGWYGWDEGDAGRFDAIIGLDGKIEIENNLLEQQGFNIFRPVEGMTIEEVQVEIKKIRQFVGLVDAH